ncbi:MAG: hypothetical protein V3W34_16270 [Phycisphaerae bacterium]
MLDDPTPRCDVPDGRTADEDRLETPLFDRAKLDEDGDLSTTRPRDLAEPRPLTDRLAREERVRPIEERGARDVERAPMLRLPLDRGRETLRDAAREDDLPR